MGKLADLYAEYLTATPKRESNGHVAVSSVLACPHQAWHEIRAGLTREFDAPTQSKFAQGHAIEDNVRNGLKIGLAKQGWSLVDNPEEGVCVDEDLDLWGHPDLVFEHDAKKTRFLVEVKSTMLFYDRTRKGVFLPDQADLEAEQPQYFLQGSAYGHAYECEKGAVFLVDRGTGIFNDYPFLIEPWYKLFSTRASLLADDLKRDFPPERFFPEWTQKSGKPFGYVCKQCPVSTCEKWSLAN